MKTTSSGKVKLLNWEFQLFLVAVSALCNFGCAEKNDIVKIFPLQSNSAAITARVTKSIPLSNQGEGIIGQIDKLVIGKDFMYILDKQQSSGLLIFSNNGLFLKKIPKGRGPGELVFPTTFNLIDNQLIIADNFNFNYYTLDGEFLFSKKLPEGWQINSFENYDADKLIIQGQTEPIAYKLTFLRC